jgi:hypothetical protein
MTDRNDYRTIIIHGKSVPKTPTINLNAVRKDTYQVNGLNSASLERKIDSGDMTLPPTISLDDGKQIAQLRMNKLINEKTMTQKQLSELANQHGGKNISVKDIQEIESGKFLLNHMNKLKLNAVKKALK